MRNCCVVRGGAEYAPYCIEIFFVTTKNLEMRLMYNLWKWKMCGRLRNERIVVMFFFFLWSDRDVREMRVLGPAWRTCRISYSIYPDN